MRLPVQGTRALSLVQQASTLHGATKPTPTEPEPAAAEAREPRACAPCREKPQQWGALAPPQGPAPARRQPEKKACTQQGRPRAARNNHKWIQLFLKCLIKSHQSNKSKMKGALQTTESDSSEIFMTLSRQKGLGDFPKWMEVTEAWLRSTIKSYSDSWNPFTLYGDSWGTLSNNFPAGNGIMSL